MIVPYLICCFIFFIRTISWLLEFDRSTQMFEERIEDGKKEWTWIYLISIYYRYFLTFDFQNVYSTPFSISTWKWIKIENSVLTDTCSSYIHNGRENCSYSNSYFSIRRSHCIQMIDQFLITLTYITHELLVKLFLFYLYSVYNHYFLSILFVIRILYIHYHSLEWRSMSFVSELSRE